MVDESPTSPPDKPQPVELVIVGVIVQGLLPVTVSVRLALHPPVPVKARVLEVNVYVPIVPSVRTNCHVPTYVGVVVGVVELPEPPLLPHAESEIKNRKPNR
jgi:hypothetical protein